MTALLTPHAVADPWDEFTASMGEVYGDLSAACERLTERLLEGLPAQTAKPPGANLTASKLGALANPGRVARTC